MKHISQQISELIAMQLETAFLKIAMILNKRPIVVRQLSVDDYYSICPADILLGRATNLLQEQIHKIDWTKVQDTGCFGFPGRDTTRLNRVKTIPSTSWNVECNILIPLVITNNKKNKKF